MTQKPDGDRSVYHAFPVSPFHADPPTVTIDGEKKQLRKYSLGFERKVIPVVRELLENPSPQDLGLMTFVAFAVFHSRTPEAASTLLADKALTESTLDLAQHELAVDDIEAIGNYIAGIIKRTDEAAVTTDGPAGKSQAEATRQTG